MAHERKLARMAHLAFHNAVRLHADSIHLFKRRSYGSALALSVLALEELGKYFLVEDLVWHSLVEGSRSEHDQQEWLKLAYSHQAKQGHFAWVADGTVARSAFKRIAKGRAERDKQRGFYVGLPRQGQRLDLLARISSPQSTGVRTAEAQITVVNDFLVVLAAGCISETMVLDIPSVEQMLTLGFARRLHRRWPSMSRPARSYVRKVATGVFA